MPDAKVSFSQKHKSKQEIVFKKDKATLHVISKRCEDTVNYSEGDLLM